MLDLPSNSVNGAHVSLFFFSRAARLTTRLCSRARAQISFIMEGLDSVQNTGPYTAEDDEDNVNGYIVLIFAIGGLLFDFISLASYHYFGEDSGAKAADADADADALVKVMKRSECDALSRLLASFVPLTALSLPLSLAHACTHSYAPEQTERHCHRGRLPRR